MGIDEIVKRHPVPAPVFYSKWHNAIANSQKFLFQRCQKKSLLATRQKFYADCPFHRTKRLPKNCFNHNTRERQFLPALKDWVSLPSTA